MSEVARVRSWLRARPLVVDTIFAVLLFGALLLPYAQPSRFHGRAGDLTPLLLVVLILCCSCVVLRRRSPWKVLALSTAIGLVGVIATRGPTPTYVPALVALYSVSSLARTGLAVRAALVSALLPVDQASRDARRLGCHRPCRRSDQNQSSRRLSTA